MGCTYIAQVVVGVPADKLLSFLQQSQTKKRYDPDTGKPYQQAVTVNITKYGDKTIENADNLDRESIIREHTPALDNFDTGESSYNNTRSSLLKDRYKWEQVVVGLQLASVDESELTALDPAEILKTKEFVAAQLTNIGYIGPVGVFLILYVGC